MKKEDYDKARMNAFDLGVKDQKEYMEKNGSIKFGKKDLDIKYEIRLTLPITTNMKKMNFSVINDYKNHALIVTVYDFKGKQK